MIFGLIFLPDFPDFLAQNHCSWVRDFSLLMKSQTELLTVCSAVDCAVMWKIPDKGSYLNNRYPGNTWNTSPSAQHRFSKGAKSSLRL